MMSLYASAEFRLAKSQLIVSAMLFAVSTSSSLAVENAKVVTPQEQAIEHIHAGEVFAATRNWSEAVREFYEACQLDDQNVVAYYDLGVALFKLHRYERAEAAVRRAIQLDSKNTDAYVQLAAILSERGDLDGAESAARRAIELDSNNLAAKESLSTITKLKDQRRRNIKIIGKPQEA